MARRRTVRATAPPPVDDPVTVWWEGPTECDLCGYGTDGRVRSVVPIGRGETAPVVPLECPGCRNMTLHPAEPEDAP